MSKVAPSIASESDFKRLIQNRTKSFISTYIPSDDYAHIISYFLTLNERILSDKFDGWWAKLVYSVYQSVKRFEDASKSQKVKISPVNSTLNPIIDVSVSVEIYNTALAILDDIEDGDYQDEKYNSNLALNATTGMIVLSQVILEFLSRNICSSQHLLKSLQALHGTLLLQICGQNDDLRNRNLENLDKDRYLQIAADKSSPELRALCEFSASLATKRKRIIKKFGDFGWNLGLANQMHSDIRDANRLDLKNDLFEGKPNLPVLFCLHTEKYGPKLKEHIQMLKRDKADRNTLEAAVKLLWESGGMNFTWYYVQLYGMKALDILTEIEAQCGQNDFLHSNVARYKIEPEEMEG